MIDLCGRPPVAALVGMSTIAGTAATERPSPKLLQDHPRQWVDRSSAAYRGCVGKRPWNPTHGSGWKLQIQPTIGSWRCLSVARPPSIRPYLNAPPTAVGGIEKRSLKVARRHQNERD